MTKEWNGLVQQMPGLLKQLTFQPLRPLKDCGVLPRKGIYVFYENGKAIYTGRTNNMKRRLSQHCSPSSGHNSATFAFIIAKRQAAEAGISINVTRSQLEKDSRFSELYLAAKERVSKMHLRSIQIDDPITQTLFEVYASMALNTMEFNDFDTH